VTTLRGSTSDFPLESVVGLLAGTSKTGELQVRGDGKVGALGFASGRLVAAVMDTEGGENALGAIFAIREADFEFTPWNSPPESNLESGDLVALLKRAAEARDRLASIREQIPDDRARFKLSEKAADQGAVTFTPDRWRALLAVNGQRDVSAIAEQLRLGKMEALTLLAGLVKDGVIEAVPPESAAPPPPMPKAAPMPMPEPPAREPSPQPAEMREETRPAEREWSPPPPEPPAPTAHEAQPAMEIAPAEPAQAEPAPEMEWTAPTQKTEPAAPSDIRDDLDAQLAERLGGIESAPAPVSEPAPPSFDDRLASLTGIFAPGPAASAPPPEAAPPQPETPPQPTDVWGAPAKPAESWMAPTPAATESPSNAWAPNAPAPPEAATEPAWTPTSPPQEAAAAPAPSPAREMERKKGGLFGMFRREEPVGATQMPRLAPAGSRVGMLASFSNALLMEYGSGSYGKGKVESRMANLLMRVDEQADPIDRPLPIVDDMIDATALEREGVAEEQAAPYLATLVRTIYEDAERVYGKDKAKRGYKAAQQQVFKSDLSSLSAPDVAGKLPKV
jgi:uncharacterized protein DUF4388